MPPEIKKIRAIMARILINIQLYGLIIARFHTLSKIQLRFPRFRLSQNLAVTDVIKNLRVIHQNVMEVAFVKQNAISRLAVNRPRQQIMQQIADRSCRNKRIDRRSADKPRSVAVI